MDVTINIFEIGESNIAEMNKLSSKLDNVDGEQMANVITTLGTSIKKYKKYSTIGFFGKMFNSDLEIQANITIALLNFETALDRGDNLVSSLQKQYDNYRQLHQDLSGIYQKFNDDITSIDGIISSGEISELDQQRMIRKKNDLITAQLLCQTTSAQYELSKENIAILIDKFKSIEQILKPAVSQNLKLGKDEFNSVLKKLIR